METIHAVTAHTACIIAFKIMLHLLENWLEMLIKKRTFSGVAKSSFQRIY